MRTRSGPLQSEDGFTLIEMMMALVILGIGIMSVVGLQTRDMAYNNTSRHQTQGYTLAMAWMEQLRGLPYGDDNLIMDQSYCLDFQKTDPEFEDCPHPPEGSPFYNQYEEYRYVVHWEVKNNTAIIPNTKRVEVQVKRRWRDPNTGEVKEVDVADVSFIRTEKFL